MASPKTVERYLKAFAKVMPQRAKIMGKLLEKKFKIDKNPEVIIRERERLMHIIGENTLFRKAEKAHKQSIRHYLWKYYKSIDFLARKRSIIEKTVDKIELDVKEIDEIKAFLHYLIERFPEAAEKMKQLDKVYIEQVDALKKADYDKYTKNIEEERKQILSILLHFKEVGDKLPVVNKFLRDVRGNLFRGKIVPAVGSLLFLFTIISFLGIMISNAGHFKLVFPESGGAYWARVSSSDFMEAISILIPLIGGVTLAMLITIKERAINTIKDFLKVAI